MSRWIEFFEGERGELSMTRLLCLMSFVPASVALLIIRTEGALGWYLGAYVLGYIGGKGADILNRPRPSPEPPNVMINQPDKVNVGSS